MRKNIESKYKMKILVIKLMGILKKVKNKIKLKCKTIFKIIWLQKFELSKEKFLLLFKKTGKPIENIMRIKIIKDKICNTSIIFFLSKNTYFHNYQE